MSRWLASLLAPLLLLPGTSAAHHGVASLGVAGLEGPGAPIETSSSATLPRGGVFGYLKVDHARFRKFTSARDDETHTNTFWIFGVGYGITSWLSAYLFLPYTSKVLEDHSFDTSGIGDMSLMGVLGLKIDEGLRLVPENESLDDLEDWHFTVYGGLSVPTGDADIEDSDGNIDPGMSLGFGKPSFTAGLTSTKTIGDDFTFSVETSYLHFLEYEYDDGNRTQFGSEFRVNAALSYRLLTLPRWKTRLDLNLETNFLRLGRDETNGEKERASGGEMLYLLPGLRGFWRNLSVGFGVKVPVWKGLNESGDQQGSEGKEKFRLIGTLSVLF